MKRFERLTVTTQPVECWVCGKTIPAGKLAAWHKDRYDNLIDERLAHDPYCPPFETDEERAAYVVRLEGHVR